MRTRMTYVAWLVNQNRLVKRIVEARYNKRKMEGRLIQVRA